MMMPALNAPAAPLAATPSMVMNFPLDDLIGAALALGVIALGVGVIGFLRTKRAVRTASVPRWASWSRT